MTEISECYDQYKNKSSIDVEQKNCMLNNYVHLLILSDEETREYG